MSSELLDDYEEGTFTPAWGDGSAAYSSPVPTYSTDGHYTKIGNVVHYDVHLVITAWNSAGTVCGYMDYHLQQEVCLYQQGGGSTFCIEGVDSQDAISNLTTQIAPNCKTSIELYYQTPATGANYNTFGTNNVSEANQVNIRVSGFYYTYP